MAHSSNQNRTGYPILDAVLPRQGWVTTYAAIEFTAQRQRRDVIGGWLSMIKTLFHRRIGRVAHSSNQNKTGCPILDAVLPRQGWVTTYAGIKSSAQRQRRDVIAAQANGLG